MELTPEMEDSIRKKMRSKLKCMEYDEHDNRCRRKWRFQFIRHDASNALDGDRELLFCHDHAQLYLRGHGWKMVEENK